MLEIAIGNTDRLIRLVNDILDIERISSGNSELHRQMCPADALLERATGLQQAAVVKTNIKFHLNGNGVEVWADPDRILQTLSNLISNAIKFSPPGGSIWLTAKKLDRDEAQFDVHDQGRGIPQDKLETIFGRFQQVDASDSKVMGGTGLGLAICRSIVEQHGGRIWATSPPARAPPSASPSPCTPKSTYASHSVRELISYVHCHPERMSGAPSPQTQSKDLRFDSQINQEAATLDKPFLR